MAIWTRMQSGSVTVYKRSKELYHQSGFKSLQECDDWIELQKEKLDNIDAHYIDDCSFHVSWGDHAIANQE
jgi:hypothetical protein